MSQYFQVRRYLNKTSGFSPTSPECRGGLEVKLKTRRIRTGINKYALLDLLITKIGSNVAYFVRTAGECNAPFHPNISLRTYCNTVFVTLPLIKSALKLPRYDLHSVPFMSLGTILLPSPRLAEHKTSWRLGYSCGIISYSTCFILRSWSSYIPPK